MDEVGNASFYGATEVYQNQPKYTEEEMVVRQGERESRELGAIETKLIALEKIVPYKCCLPSSNIGVKKDFDTDILFN